jgi:hypothetical protein
MSDFGKANLHHVIADRIALAHKRRPQVDIVGSLAGTFFVIAGAYLLRYA